MSLKLAITDTVSLFEQRGVNKTQLKKETALQLRQPIGEREFDEALRDLKARELITESRDMFTDDQIFTITERGAKWLAQQ